MMPKHYCALMAGPKSIKVVEALAPKPGPGQVKVRLEGCGVCASSLPVWEGRPWFEYPMQAGAPGHEGWGVIDEVGPEVHRLNTGQRVALLSYHAFGEVEVIDQKRAVVLPKEIDGMDFPGEALGCAVNIYKRAHIQAGQHVAIIGTGFLGAMLTQLASAAGAVVIAISRRESSLEIARKMGATHVIPMTDHFEIIREVERITSGNFCDCVIEATGFQWPLDLAGELCAERARLVVAGYHQDGPRQVNMQLWNWRGIDVINAHERSPETYLEGMRAAIAEIVAGRLDPRPLFTHRFPLDDLAEAFGLLGSREGTFVKALAIYD